MTDDQEVVDSEDSAEKPENPWVGIIVGALMIAGGIFVYFYLANWEQEGGSIRMNVIIMLVYDLLGKVGVAALCCLIGAVMIWASAKDLIGGKS